METPNPSGNLQTVPGETYNIIVHSIGEAGASLVPALKKISPLSENSIAGLLFQAPSMLFSNLPLDVANKMNDLLVSTGLDSSVVKDGEPFVAGDNKHEIALVVNDYTQIADIARIIIELTGSPIQDVRQILCKSPTVLIGKISANTAKTIKKRFEPYQVDVDISNPYEAAFDVFLGECSKMDQSRIANILKSSGLPYMQSEDQKQMQALICSGLTKKQADVLWDSVYRTSLPMKIVNRDFERFDLQLNKAPDTPEFIEFLTSTTGMPEKVARKVIKNLPVVIHKNIAFDELDGYMDAIVSHGGTATGHLLVFQTFSLKFESIKDVSQTVEVINVLGGIDKTEVVSKIKNKADIEGPFTSPQIQWLQYELKKIGTETKRLLR